jgi:hypothetical protein
VKRFACTHHSGESTRETLAAETPREAAEAHVRGLYGLDDADGSHLVTVERDGVVQRMRVFVTITVCAVHAPVHPPPKEPP